jgi:hypothetical protein
MSTAVVAVFYIAEVPDGAFVVLGEPVLGLVDELAAFPSPVIDHDAPTSPRASRSRRCGPETSFVA